jgi:hypothetical protein
MSTAIATHHVRAVLIRKVSASTGLSGTMRKAVRVLAEAGIPSLVVGGYAVQEHGYARFTSDVDIVVPNVAAAREVLTQNGFRENAGSSTTVTDRISKVEVDLLPGGKSVGPGPLLLPMPAAVSAEPTIANLRTLIEIKLSSYLGSPVSRNQDLSDVIALSRRTSCRASSLWTPPSARRFSTPGTASPWRTPADRVPHPHDGSSSSGWVIVCGSKRPPSMTTSLDQNQAVSSSLSSTTSISSASGRTNMQSSLAIDSTASAMVEFRVGSVVTTKGSRCFG